MNKYMKKLAAGLLAFALMVMLLPAGVVVSFAASGKTFVFRPDCFGGRPDIRHDEDCRGRSTRFLRCDASV